MYDGKFLRIVEVRSLYYPNVQRPAESINRKKKTLVMRAARRFVSLHKIKNEIAFDVVSVVMNGEFSSVEYIADAFAPEW